MPGRKPGHAADIPESAGYPDRSAANPSRIARHLAARITRTGYLAGSRKRNFPRKEPDTPAGRAAATTTFTFLLAERMPFVKLRIRARTGQAGEAHARNGIPGRLRRLTATTLVLVTTTGGGLAAYGLTASTPASAHTIARAAADPTLAIAKSVFSIVNTPAGRQITYKYTVTNPTNLRFFDVSVGDTRVIGGVPSRFVVCTVVAGPLQPFSPGASATCFSSVITGAMVTNTGAALVRGIANSLSNTVIVPPAVPVTG